MGAGIDVLNKYSREINGKNVTSCAHIYLVIDCWGCMLHCHFWYSNFFASLFHSPVKARLVFRVPRFPMTGFWFSLQRIQAQTKPSLHHCIIGNGTMVHGTLVELLHWKGIRKLRGLNGTKNGSATCAKPSSTNPQAPGTLTVI